MFDLKGWRLCGGSRSTPDMRRTAFVPMDLPLDGPESQPEAARKALPIVSGSRSGKSVSTVEWEGVCLSWPGNFFRWKQSINTTQPDEWATDRFDETGGIWIIRRNGSYVMHYEAEKTDISVTRSMMITFSPVLPLR